MELQELVAKFEASVQAGPQSTDLEGLQEHVATLEKTEEALQSEVQMLIEEQKADKAQDESTGIALKEKLEEVVKAATKVKRTIALDIRKLKT